MANIISTIPKHKFSSWETGKTICEMCDGTTKRQFYDEDPAEWFWLINVAALPTKVVPGESVCYMVYDGMVRGYFDIIKTDDSRNWGSHDPDLVNRDTKCLVMANWHPCTPFPMKGFQGYRYTDKRP